MLSSAFLGKEQFLCVLAGLSESFLSSYLHAKYIQYEAEFVRYLDTHSIWGNTGNNWIFYNLRELSGKCPTQCLEILFAIKTSNASYNLDICNQPINIYFS